MNKKKIPALALAFSMICSPLMANDLPHVEPNPAESASVTIEEKSNFDKLMGGLLLLTMAVSSIGAIGMGKYKPKNTKRRGPQPRA